jgi:uncharacterized membrane protein
MKTDDYRHQSLLIAEQDAVPPDAPRTKRLNSIDVVRGVVMVIMALDHTRDFMHVTSLTQSPTDMATTTPAVFFTRWITHFCAPIFVFLAGTSAYLSSRRDNNLAATRSFLLKRGIWLVILEFTLINFALWFDIKFHNLIFQVIAAIGFSFMVLALLLPLSTRTIGIIGLVIIFGHDLFFLLPLKNYPTLQAILMPLFNLTIYQVSTHLTFLLAYPVIPWLGILLTGYAAGRLFELPTAERKGLFLKMGFAALTLFVVLRFINVYGDPAKWSVQASKVYTVLSFFNVSKYPPSLLFTLMTLSGMFLALAAVENADNRFTRIMTTYGKVPMFYYLPHLYLLHILMFMMVFLQGYTWSDMVFGFNFGRPNAPSGVELWAIYLIWLAAVAILYPLCKWYGRYKASHRDNHWLRYL